MLRAAAPAAAERKPQEASKPLFSFPCALQNLPQA